MVRKITDSTGKLASRAFGAASAVPLNIVGPLRRFWDFTKQTAGKFAKNFKDPEAKEQEFINIVRRDSERWT